MVAVTALCVYITWQGDPQKRDLSGQTTVYNTRRLSCTVKHQICGRDALRNVGQAHKDVLDVALEGHYMSMKDQEQFKYIVYAEGRFGWSNRLQTLLGMGNAIIKQVNNGGFEWYTFGLQPWMHYIPTVRFALRVTLPGPM